MKIIDYTILSSISANGLVRGVKDLLKEGWQPQGGIGFDAFSNTHTQAMVKYE